MAYLFPVICSTSKNVAINHLGIFFCIISTDYATGFGGKYGVQKDHVDESAVGYDYRADLSKHESQKGTLFVFELK